MNSYESAIARKKALIEKAKQQALSTEGALSKKVIEFILPEEAENKLRIFFDNSGSMYRTIGDKEAIAHAREGVIEFLRSCTPNKDAVAVHLLNSSHLTKSEALDSLHTNLIKLSLKINESNIYATGGTPLFETIKSGQLLSPEATRFIAFSDGAPNNYIDEPTVVQYSKEHEAPIDTVFFGDADSQGFETMKSLAEATGGIFLHYDPTKKVSFKDLFKYLAPAKRLMLMDAEFKAKLERGDIKA